MIRIIGFVLILVLAFSAFQSHQIRGLRADLKKMTDVAHEATSDREQYRTWFLNCFDGDR